MPLRHQDSSDSYRKNHKEFIISKLHIVKLSAFRDFVAKNPFIRNIYRNL